MSYFRIFQFPTLLLAGASAFSMSTLFSAMKPVLLTRYVEQAGFSESLAGLVVAMPFVGIAVAGSDAAAAAGDCFWWVVNNHGARKCLCL